MTRCKYRWLLATLVLWFLLGLAGVLLTGLPGQEDISTLAVASVFVGLVTFPLARAHLQAYGTSHATAKATLPAVAVPALFTGVLVWIPTAGYPAVALLPVPAVAAGILVGLPVLLATIGYRVFATISVLTATAVALSAPVTGHVEKQAESNTAAHAWAREVLDASVPLYSVDALRTAPQLFDHSAATSPATATSAEFRAVTGHGDALIVTTSAPGTGQRCVPGSTTRPAGSGAQTSPTQMAVTTTCTRIGEHATLATTAANGSAPPVEGTGSAALYVTYPDADVQVVGLGSGSVEHVRTRATKLLGELHRVDLSGFTEDELVSAYLAADDRLVP